MALLSICIGVATVILMGVIWRANARMPGPGYWFLGSLLSPAVAGVTVLLRDAGEGAAPLRWEMAYTSLVAMLLVLVIEGVIRFMAAGHRAADPARGIVRPLVVLGIAAVSGPVLFHMVSEPALRLLAQDAALILLIVAALLLVLRGAPDISIPIRIFGCIAFVMIGGSLISRWLNTYDFYQGEPGIDLRSKDGTAQFLFTVWSFWWTYAVVLMVLKRSQARIEALTREDALTGLPNRREFDRVFEAAVRPLVPGAVPERAGIRGAAPPRANPAFAVLTFDLDGFKEINDTIGHLAGDDCLIEVGRRLRAFCRSGDLPARFGGDEFVILVKAVATEDDLAAVMARLQAAVEGPALTRDGRDVMIRLSLGGALVPGDGINQTDVLHVADQRMYKAKQERRRKSWPRPAAENAGDITGETVV
ncbi:GGDEF domain-containing protein [Novispirillum itersonii]|uniref:Diguanylate cyclase (GGDEF)-like protein n=1 Tax=Novispirillum itersonii TaxID=189 RepID=A0A7X0DLM7_NOVIT|nr:GGDEF domain-containing protein [Novispirillum itersonii]MBB6210150.1 diguanylate cyclase (GGDEF)-like protein [Novispirillum itersonii]